MCIHMIVVFTNRSTFMHRFYYHFSNLHCI